MINALSKYYLLALIFIISLFILSCSEILTDDDVCGKTFSESESNNSISEASDLNITLQSGCKVTITGSVSTDDDYFIFNSGGAERIKLTLKWTYDSNNANLDLFLRDYYTDLKDSSVSTTSDVEEIEYNNTDYQQFYAQVKLTQLTLGASGGQVDYTLVIEGLY